MLMQIVQLMALLCAVQTAMAAVAVKRLVRDKGRMNIIMP